MGKPILSGMAAPLDWRKELGRYVVRSKELARSEPVVSYYCLNYALEQGMEVMNALPESEKNVFQQQLMTWMGEAEQECTASHRSHCVISASVCRREPQLRCPMWRAVRIARS